MNIMIYDFHKSIRRFYMNKINNLMDGIIRYDFNFARKGLDDSFLNELYIIPYSRGDRRIKRWL